MKKIFIKMVIKKLGKIIKGKKFGKTQISIFKMKIKLKNFIES